MSTQISKSLIALFFLGMFVTGCNTNTKQTADNDIKFDSIRVDRTYHLLNNPDNPNCNLQLNFTYPAKFSDKEILKKIQNDFVLSYFGENYENLSPEEAVAKYTEDYLNNYKELEADFKAELEKKDDLPVGAWFSYFEMSSDEIVYNLNDILSYTVSFENYTGGAHGSHAYNNHCDQLENRQCNHRRRYFHRELPGQPRTDIDRSYRQTKQGGESERFGKHRFLQCRRNFSER